MEPLKRSLKAKIKTLNETIWENRATDPAITEWLDNFSHSANPSDDETIHALFLLSNFMFFGDREIRGLLKALYRDVYRYPIVEAIRRGHGDTLDSGIIDPQFKMQLQRTRFLGVGNPSESGCHLLYYFRQENNLPKDLFIHTHQIFTRHGASGSLDLRDTTVLRYVFIDDFCGSGKQGSEYSQDLVEDIKRLKPDAFVAYYVLFATANGIKKLSNDTKFDSARAIYELDSSFKCFVPESRFFRNPVTGVDQTVCERISRQYGEKMVAAAHALGYENSQLLIGFHHNTPDNTLPIIWFDEPGRLPWKPIFRRYPKLEW
jgi:hypothetical protein